jgi:hypothetical protein
LIVQVRLAGLWSVLPALSVALTWKVWEPLDKPLYALGEVQEGSQGLPSRLHSNVEPLSEEEKPKLADVEPVVLPSDGPELIVVSGGVVSAGGGGGVVPPLLPLR